MKKVLFLMFLLLLMGLGAVGVKAQVRIGGNVAPNAAAVLDLNPTDATTGTQGLALPRVDITSDTMKLVIGTSNLNGMLVYNTGVTLVGASGIYFWNGSIWVRVDAARNGIPIDTVALNRSAPVTWTLIVDTLVSGRADEAQLATIRCPGLTTGDICLLGQFAGTLKVTADINRVSVLPMLNGVTFTNAPLQCFRPFY